MGCSSIGPSTKTRGAQSQQPGEGPTPLRGHSGRSGRRRGEGGVRTNEPAPARSGFWQNEPLRSLRTTTVRRPDIAKVIMVPTFTGRTTDLLLARGPCFFPSCMELAKHTHHVTYKPEVTKPLCVRHHKEITILNGQHGRRVRHRLSNGHRWYIWYQWMAGKMKIRRTRKSQEYLNSWDRAPRCIPEPPQEEHSDGGSPSGPKTPQKTPRKPRTAKSGHREAGNKQEVSEQPKRSAKKPIRPKKKRK
jgi:hypothetical protein